MNDKKDRGARDNKIFYGWVIVIASFVSVAVMMGLVFSFGVFLKPLQEHFLWSRASISIATSINWTTLGLFSLLFGFLSDRVGIRKVAYTGGLVYGAGLLLTSQVEELWQLYITFGVMTGVGMGAFYVPLNSLAAKWFDKRRGIAVATVSSGSGLGVLIFSPFSRFLIDMVGFRWAYVVLGLIVLGVVLPLSSLLRNAPGDTTENNAEDGFQSGTVEVAQDAGSSFKTPTFWALALTHFLCCTAHSGPIYHLVAFATDSGIPKMTAATIFGVMGISNFLGRIGAGHLSDKIGSKRSLIIFLTLQAATIFSFAFAQHTWHFYTSGLIFGMAFGSVMPMYALMVREYFGPRTMGTIYGSVFMVSSVGMGIGPYLGGYIFDTSDSYLWLYVAASIIATSAVFMSTVLKPPGYKLWRERLVEPELSG